MRRTLPLLLSAATLLAGACGDLLSTAAATVDGRKIDEDRFVRELDFLLGDPRVGQQFPAGEAGELQREDVGRRYLTFLIHQQLVERFADERSIEVDGSEVDALLQQQVADLGGQAQFDGLLRRAEATEGDVRHLLEQQLLRQKVAEAVVAEEVPQQQLRQIYEERVLEFSEVHVAHILVPSEREAERVADQATPQNFSALARRFSEDTASAQNGGDLGPQRAADLVSPFARAALRIPVGEVGGPVETDFGFHLIHVMERETLPFEEVQQQLLEEVRGDVFTGWLLERLELAEVRVNPRYGYFDETSGAVLERSATSPKPTPSIQLAP
jgi:foldase protein PrsA